MSTTPLPPPTIGDLARSIIDLDASNRVACTALMDENTALKASNTAMKTQAATDAATIADLRTQLAALTPKPATAWGSTVPYEGYVGLTRFVTDTGTTPAVIRTYPVGKGVDVDQLTQTASTMQRYPNLPEIVVACLYAARKITDAQIVVWVKRLQGLTPNVKRRRVIMDAECDRKDRTYSGQASSVSAAARQANADRFCTDFIHFAQVVRSVDASIEVWVNLTASDPQHRVPQHAKALAVADGLAADPYWNTAGAAEQGDTASMQWMAADAKQRGIAFALAEWSVITGPQQAVLLGPVLDAVRACEPEFSCYNPGGPTPPAGLGDGTLTAEAAKVYKAKTAAA